MPERIAAIFAHPDDEVLGCGAALARHAAEGSKVHILILATGLAARGAAAQEQLEALRNDAERAAAALGAASVSFGEFPDNAMDSVPLLEVVRRVEAFLAECAPRRVYTHHVGDLNVDHGVTHRAVVTACRPMVGAVVREILSCEVNSSTEWTPPGSLPAFLPTEFMDVSASLAAKLAALACYAGELRDWPHPRSLEGVVALAKWRGSQAGFQAAEAFVTVRRLVGPVGAP